MVAVPYLRMYDSEHICQRFRVVKKTSSIFFSYIFQCSDAGGTSTIGMHNCELMSRS